ncbi:hypothetical protein M406DRAFT_75102 [Cryphonectria parasitica EP155]|uniref:Uncharacterized protein n=1 Tax=Cryphonectria parasitica (strain ATCC 38755 / EP155) TaxID=660469 RepID=A0A9P4XYW8_CRYP1|nr:uncharacterized protein M406DRAFT_75102 [Cryphonectria parasitica EP155]KAF3763869.1 hypothetical protein M406DRAFT_75102 [Cryphonectria parasitica EP155]
MYTQSLFLAALTGVATASVLPPRDSSPGVNIYNMGSAQQTFYFCNNAANGDGTADPGFTSGTSGCSNLVTSVAVAPSASTTVALATTFSGRIARSTDTPATWVEVQFQSGGTAWGDVSLEIGCDGPAQVGPASGGGSAQVVGFSTPADIVSGAPDGATETRADGVKVISAPYSEGQVTNQAAADYLLSTVPQGNTMAYITTTSGTDVTTSSNNQLDVTFY